MLSAPTPADSGIGPIRVAEIIGALSLAGDLGMGQPMGHLLRTCFIAMRICDRMALAEPQRAEVYYTAMLVHGGCTAGAQQFTAFLAADDIVAQRELCLCDPSSLRDVLGWMWRNAAPADASLAARMRSVVQVFLGGDQAMAEFDRGCSEVGARLAQRLRMPDGVVQALANACEIWNGRGLHRLSGESIPLSTRVVNAAMTLEVFASGRGRAAAEEAARQRSGKTFDPLVVDAFLAEARASSFWETLGSGDLWDAALAWEPESVHRYLPEDALDDVALVFADFADLKSTYTAAHSRATAQLAEAIAREIRLPPDQLAQLRRAALVHDLGLVAVPSRLIEQQAPLSAAEQEQLRLHPLLTERILSRVPVLQPIGSLAAMHHEWLNGTGYPRGLSAPDLPVAARILAVADAFQELAEDRPGRPGSGAAHAVQVIEREAGSRFDRACLEALGRVLGLTSARRVRAYFPAGLTEREIEVVRLLGRGRTNRQIAESLVLTEKTVAHHLDHIYNKMGVSSRTAAVLWAMEQGLLT